MNHHFTVQGMNCSHCEREVKQALERVDPAAVVSISLPDGQVQVQSGQSRTQLVQAIEQAGYAVNEDN